jgi:hypothetical protein
LTGADQSPSQCPPDPKDLSDFVNAVGKATQAWILIPRRDNGAIGGNRSTHRHSYPLSAEERPPFASDFPDAEFDVHSSQSPPDVPGKVGSA